MLAKTTALSMAFLVCCCAQLMAAELDSNWPRWRGPHDNGSIELGNYPVEWKRGSVPGGAKAPLARPRGLLHRAL